MGIKYNAENRFSSASGATSTNSILSNNDIGPNSSDSMATSPFSSNQELSADGVQSGVVSGAETVSSSINHASSKKSAAKSMGLFNPAYSKQQDSKNGDKSDELVMEQIDLEEKGKRSSESDTFGGEERAVDLDAIFSSNIEKEKSSKKFLFKKSSSKAKKGN